MPNRKTDRDGSGTSLYIDEIDSYLLKDIDGVSRVIPRKNFIKAEPQSLAILGTNITALTFLIKEIQSNPNSFSTMLKYDSLRDKH